MNLAPYPLTLQMQPTPCSCTATCIAMALGLSVADLGVPITNALDFDDFGVWLAERGIWMRQGVRINTHGERFSNGCVYLIGVRSLNILNSDHTVLVDTRGPRKEGANFNSRSGWITLDPIKGWEGKQFYEWVDETVVLDFCELRDRRSAGITVGSVP